MHIFGQQAQFSVNKHIFIQQAHFRSTDTFSVNRHIFVYKVQLYTQHKFVQPHDTIRSGQQKVKHFGYLFSSLDSDLHGLKDHILASEDLTTNANAYSPLLHLSLRENSTIPKVFFSVLSSKGRGDTMIVEAMVFVVVLAVVPQLVNFVAVLMVMVAILLEILIGCAVIMVFPIKPSLIIGRNLVSQIICIKSLMVKHTITCFYSIWACNSWFWFS